MKLLYKKLYLQQKRPNQKDSKCINHSHNHHWLTSGFRQKGGKKKKVHTWFKNDLHLKQSA